MAEPREFCASRLTIARKRRGVTKTGLAKSIGMTVRIISMYERDDAVPSEDALGRISSALTFPEAFFYRDEIEEVRAEGASFRSLASMTAGNRDRALATGSLAVELSEWIGERFRLPKADIPSLRGFSPEAAAEALRAHWGIGTKPCPNAVHLLEANGCRVFSLPRDSKSVSAFSFWHDDVPYVFLTTHSSGERGRFDALHELGHLAMHVDGRLRGREAEIEADQFASAFLMPKPSVDESAPYVPVLDNLIRIKRKWGASIAALVRRLFDLKHISEWQYRSLCIELAQRGHRRSEPSGIERERSKLLSKVFGMLRDDGVTRSAIAKELSLRTSDLDAMIFGLSVTDGSREGRPATASPSGEPRLRIV